MTDRKCCVCGEKVEACMASTLARDFVAAVDGEIPWSAVREVCALCQMRIEVSGSTVADAIP